LAHSGLASPATDCPLSREKLTRSLARSACQRASKESCALGLYSERDATIFFAVQVQSPQPIRYSVFEAERDSSRHAYETRNGKDFVRTQRVAAAFCEKSELLTAGESEEERGAYPCKSRRLRWPPDHPFAQPPSGVHFLEASQKPGRTAAFKIDLESMIGGEFQSRIDGHCAP
jgi:hypothetical protein